MKPSVSNKHRPGRCSDRGEDCSVARCTDCLFDNNNHAFPDGARIRVSAAHACVHEDGRGNIIASDGAFGIPPLAHPDPQRCVRRTAGSGAPVGMQRRRRLASDDRPTRGFGKRKPSASLFLQPRLLNATRLAPPAGQRDDGVDQQGDQQGAEEAGGRKSAHEPGA